jgi:hypothetical protein
MSGDSEITSNRPLIIRLCAIFAVALVVRLIGLWILFPEDGWKTVSYGSELGQIAANLAEGRGYSSPFSAGTQPTAWVAPLVPLLWALVFKAAGVFSPASLVCLGILQCIVSAAACCFYFLILRRLLSPLKGSGRYWLWGGLALLILWPLCLRAAATFWYFSWQECAFAGLFWAALMWLDHRTWRWAICLGCYAGCIALINPVTLVLYAGITLAMGRRDEKGKEAGNRLAVDVTARDLTSFAQLCLSLVVFCILLGPWTARNAVRFPALVPIRSSFGVALLQGNNPDGAIVQTANSLHPALNEQEKIKFLEMGEYNYDRAARKLATQYIWNYPGKTAKRVFQRIYVFWCSDIRGDWPWGTSSDLNHSEWCMSRKCIKAMLWVGPLLVFGWIFVSGRLLRIPYKELFVALFIFYPLPFYLANVSPMYAYALQPYILMMCVAGMRKQKS